MTPATLALPTGAIGLQLGLFRGFLVAIFPKPPKPQKRPRRRFKRTDLHDGIRVSVRISKTDYKQLLAVMRDQEFESFSELFRDALHEQWGIGEFEEPAPQATTIGRLSPHAREIRH